MIVAQHSSSCSVLSSNDARTFHTIVTRANTNWQRQESLLGCAVTHWVTSPHSHADGRSDRSRQWPPAPQYPAHSADRFLSPAYQSRSHIARPPYTLKITRDPRILPLIHRDDYLCISSCIAHRDLFITIIMLGLSHDNIININQHCQKPNRCPNVFFSDSIRYFIYSMRKSNNITCSRWEQHNNYSWRLHGTGGRNKDYIKLTWHPT